MHGDRRQCIPGYVLSCRDMWNFLSIIYFRADGESGLQHLIQGSLENADGIASMRDGTGALVGVLAMVTGAVGIDMDEPRQ